MPVAGVTSSCRTHTCVSGKTADALCIRDRPVRDRVQLLGAREGRHVEDRRGTPSVTKGRQGEPAVRCLRAIRGSVGPTKSAGMLEGGRGAVHADDAR